MQTMLSLSTVQIYDHFTYLCSFILHLRDKYELSIDQLPAGWIAQLVRVLHRYRRGHEFDSCSSLNFSGFFFSTALACEQAFSGVGARRREKRRESLQRRLRNLDSAPSTAVAVASAICFEIHSIHCKFSTLNNPRKKYSNSLSNIITFDF